MRVVEYRQHVLRFCKEPAWVDVTQLGNFRGFRSVYEYEHELVKHLDSTKDIKHLPAYSDTLFVDFDDNTEAAMIHWEGLKEQGISGTCWDSGNRSVHFHIDIVPMLGRQVPRTQRNWVREHFPEADVSFYHHAGMFRLPLTFHSKNPGHLKHLLDEHEGSRLRIPIATTVAPRTTTRKERSEYNMLATAQIMTDAHTGNREPHLYKLTRTLRDSGATLEMATREVLFWNHNFAHPPHADDYVVRRVQQIYDRS